MSTQQPQIEQKNVGNGNMISKLLSIFNWEINCQCCGTRMDPQLEQPTSNDSAPERLTASSEKAKNIHKGVHKLDESYLQSLLEQFSGCSRLENAPIRKKKHNAPTVPKWNNQLEDMFRQAVAMYGTNIDLIHAFFPGFGKQFLERKIKKIERLSENTPWTQLEDSLLIDLLYKNQGSFQAAASGFKGRTLENLQSRFELLKSNGGVSKFLEKGRTLPPRLPSINNMEMEAEDPAAAKYEFEFNAMEDEALGNKDSCFDFSFDPIAEIGSSHRDIFDQDVDNEAADSFHNLFGRREMGSLNEIYENQISQIFGGDSSQAAPFHRNQKDTQGEGDVQAFIDINNSDGSMIDENNSDESPTMKMRVRPMQPAKFSDMMM